MQRKAEQKKVKKDITEEERDDSEESEGKEEEKGNLKFETALKENDVRNRLREKDKKS